MLNNDFGLTRIAFYDSTGRTPPLEKQLTDMGVSYRIRELPSIVGMGGNARLVFYTSPFADHAVTVLVVPGQPEIDQQVETYWYFEGLSEAVATAGDVDTRWAELYDQCRAVPTFAPWKIASIPVTSVAVGAVVVESINAIRHRVTAVTGDIVHMVPVDNPRGLRRRSGAHINHLRDCYRLLTDPELLALGSAEYGERLGLATPTIEWVPYSESDSDQG